MIELPEAPLYDGVLCWQAVLALLDPNVVVVVDDAAADDKSIYGGHPQAVVALQARLALGQRRFFIQNQTLCSGAADTLYKGTAVCAPHLVAEVNRGILR